MEGLELPFSRAGGSEEAVRAQSRVPLQLAPAPRGTFPISFGAFPAFDLEINNLKKKRERRADGTDPSQPFTALCSWTAAVSLRSLHPGPLGQWGDDQAEHRLGAETQAEQKISGFPQQPAFSWGNVCVPLPRKACFNRNPDFCLPPLTTPLTRSHVKFLLPSFIKIIPLSNSQESLVRASLVSRRSRVSKASSRPACPHFKAPGSSPVLGALRQSMSRDSGSRF